MAKKTPASYFLPSLFCVRVWTQDIEVDSGRSKSRPGPWMSTSSSESSSGRYSMPEQPRGVIRALATPETVDMMLRSNWGPPTAGVYVLKSKVNEWMTLAWVEDLASGSTQNLIRTSDAWIHRLTIRNHRTDGRVLLIGEYEARENTVNALNALPVGVTIPASPAAPADQRVYPVMRAEFTSDPGGTPVKLLYTELDITLDQRLSGEWTFSDKWDVWKRGKTLVTVDLKGMLSYETWTLLDAARAGTKGRFLFSATAPALAPLSASTFSIDIKSMDFEVDEIGHDATNGWVTFSASGRALIDSSSGDFLTITKT